MAAPYQIIPATLADAAEILDLEQLCYPDPWSARVIRPFVVAATIPRERYVARIIREGAAVVGYALASQQARQLLVERLGIRPENRRLGIGSRLIVSLMFIAHQMKLPAITCSLDEQNLGGQLFLKYGGFKAVSATEEAKVANAIQFARLARG